MLSLAVRLAGILCALAIALPAFADDVQDAAKLLKAGQHKQALERVNKALALFSRLGWIETEGRGRYKIIDRQALEDRATL